MITIAPVSRETMMERARAAESARRAVSSAPLRPPPKNLTAILSLGDETFFAFRGRAYGVPNPPWKVSELIDDLYTRALDSIRTMRLGASDSPEFRKARDEYRAAIKRIPAILWANCRPVGPVRSVLRRLGVLRNPFDAATDRELLDLIDFFWRCRTRSGVQFPT